MGLQVSKDEVNQKLESKDFGKKLLRVAFGSTGFRFANILLSFVISAFLTRTLGLEGYGIYAYSISWVLLLNVVSSLGCRGLIVREIAANRTRQQWGLIQGLLRWSNGLILLTSVSIAIVFALITTRMQGVQDAQTLQALRIALCLVPLMALTILRQSSMQGFGYILKGQLPENILQPLLFIALLVPSYFLLSQGDFSASNIMLLKVASTFIAFIIGALLLYYIVPKTVKHAEPEYKVGEWFPSMMSMLFIVGTGVIYTRSDTVMLGLLSGPSAVGLYAVSLRGANFILISQQVAANILGPHVASLHACNNRVRLQQLTTKSTRLVMAYAVPVSLAFIFLGPIFLSVFGEDFQAGYGVLVILCVSKLIGVAVGPVGLLLTMTHNERDNAVIVAIGAIVNAALNYLLIPQYGAEGAAIATGFSSIAVNVFLAAIVYKRLRINSTILSF